MGKIDDGGAAFPEPFQGHCGERDHAATCGCYLDKGMTLRDWFAGQALIGGACLSARALKVMKAGGQLTAKDVAEVAYEVADAMIAARNGEEQSEDRPDGDE